MSNMVVQTNVLALNAHRNMKGVGDLQQKSSQKLSSGYRINSAADDAAGLSISEKMRSQIRGLDMASKNSQDAISLIQTAEGGMNEIDNMVQRIRELIVYASNDTMDYGSGVTGTAATGSAVQGDRQKVQDEINSLMQEIDSMADRVQFNKKNLIDGSFASGTNTPGVSTNSGIYFQVGPNANQGWNLFIGSITCSALGLAAAAGMHKTTAMETGQNTATSATMGGDAGATTNAGAKLNVLSGSLINLNGMTGSGVITGLLDKLDNALTIVTTERSKLGAAQNRLEYTIKSLDISSENLSAAESRIRDTDMAAEMMNLTKANVLQQSTISMLAQANQAPQSLLSLLR